MTFSDSGPKGRPASGGIARAAPVAACENALGRLARVAVRTDVGSMAAVVVFEGDSVTGGAAFGFDRGGWWKDELIVHASNAKADLHVVRDTHLEEGLTHSALVHGAPGVRYFASHALYDAAGVRCGLLVVFDTQPRRPTGDERETIADLARLAGREIGRRSTSLQLRVRLLDSVGHAVVATDPEGRIIYCNAAAEQLYGYAASSVVGRLIMDVTPSDAVRARAAEILRTVEAGEPWSGEFEIEREDGSSVWVHVVETPVRDEAGELVAIVGASIDITDRKAAERARALSDERLCESEERWRQLVEHMPVSMIISVEGRIAYINPDATALLGADAPVELMGRPASDFVVDDELDDFRRRMRVVSSQGTNPARVYRIERDDGPDRYVEALSVPTRFRGQAAVLMVALDITERQRYENALMQAKERAEEMIRLKDVLLSNMSHEIRTPLTAILGFADLLAEELEGEQRELVDMILKGGDRLMNTLTAVLDLAQTESGAVRLQLARLDAGALVQQVVGQLQTQARAKNLMLTLDVPSGGLVMSTDAEALERVVGHIVGNAVKFTEEGTVRVRIVPDHDDVRVTVEDTGVGISDWFRPHLFEAFQQESNGLARQYEGNGLGLAVAIQLVNLLAGDIDIESEKGVGTTVQITLPREHPQSGTAAGSPREIETPRFSGNGAASKRVLVVTRDDAQWATLEKAVAVRNQVHVVQGAEEALVAARADPFDLVLLDVRLGAHGHGDADDVRFALRRWPAYQHVPILALATQRPDGEVKVSNQDGFDGRLEISLARPVPERMAALLEAVLHAYLGTASDLGVRSHPALLAAARQRGLIDSYEQHAANVTLQIEATALQLTTERARTMLQVLLHDR